MISGSVCEAMPAAQDVGHMSRQSRAMPVVSAFAVPTFPAILLAAHAPLATGEGKHKAKP